MRTRERTSGYCEGRGENPKEGGGGGITYSSAGSASVLNNFDLRDSRSLRSGLGDGVGNGQGGHDGDNDSEDGGELHFGGGVKIFCWAVVVVVYTLEYRYIREQEKTKEALLSY